MSLTAATPAKPEAGPLLRLALDLGPLVIYFLSYAAFKHVYPAQPGGVADPHVIYASTGTFMAATAIAMVVSRVRLGAISLMQWFSAAMVLILGGLTLVFQKPWFIQVKPTLYYLLVSGILWFGLLTGKPTLKLALGSAYPGLDERGWVLLSRNWALFFMAMAAANEVVWRHFSFDFWIGYKLWGALPATMIFAAANIPMLLKHGLGETPAEAIADAPSAE